MERQIGVFVLALLWWLLSFKAQPSTALSCVNDNDDAVEWFIGYKFHDSLNYASIDSKSRNITWKASSHTIDKGGMMKSSFDAAFATNGKPSSTYVMYNDEWPKKSIRTTKAPNNYWWAHMKGIFAFDESETGLWIIHSVPKLSYRNDSYEFPLSGHVYGQHMFCMTLSKTALPDIIELMRIARPLVQGSWVSNEIALKYPDIKLLIDDHRRDMPEKSGVKDFSAYSKLLKLKYFSKSKHFGKDLYADLVAPTLESNFMVESWRHGPHLLPSTCNTKYKVENIEDLSWKNFDLKFTLKTTDDHAKWAVAYDNSLSQLKPKGSKTERKNWICLGDINRAVSQEYRGGGTMCINNGHLWNLFFQLITAVEACPK